MGKSRSPLPGLKNGHTGLEPCEKELFLGSKVFGICIFSLKQVEKGKADYYNPNTYSQ